MIPGSVHAVLVLVFAFLLRWLFTTFLGIDLAEDVYLLIAANIASYILSLVTLGLFNRLRPSVKSFTVTTTDYKPPFT